MFETIHANPSSLSWSPPKPSMCPLRFQERPPPPGPSFFKKSTCLLCAPHKENRGEPQGHFLPSPPFHGLQGFASPGTSFQKNSGLPAPASFLFLFQIRFPILTSWAPPTWPLLSCPNPALKFQIQMVHLLHLCKLGLSLLPIQ